MSATGDLLMSDLKHNPNCPTQPGGDVGGINRNYHCNCCLAERNRIKELEDDKMALQASYEKALNMVSAGNKRIKELEDFCIWMTGCGYDFCQHNYFIEQRDKLLKQHATKEESE